MADPGGRVVAGTRARVRYLGHGRGKRSACRSRHTGLASTGTLPAQDVTPTPWGTVGPRVAECAVHSVVRRSWRLRGRTQGTGLRHSAVAFDPGFRLMRSREYRQTCVRLPNRIGIVVVARLDSADVMELLLAETLMCLARQRDFPRRVRTGACRPALLPHPATTTRNAALAAHRWCTLERAHAPQPGAPLPNDLA